MNSASLNILGHVFWSTCAPLSLEYIPKNGITGSTTVDAISFPKWLYQFTLPSIIYANSDFSTSSPLLGIVSVLLTFLVRLVYCAVGINFHFPVDK